MTKSCLCSFPLFLLAAVSMFGQDRFGQDRFGQDRFGQDSVTIRVNAANKIGPYKPITGYFGYDEPNFTYAKNGAKLVKELGNLAGSKSDPVYIRTHFMLTTGDGTAGFKWGSTNAYTEDADGKPVYDWTISDRIIDTYIQSGTKPFIEVGFMPKALSSHPDPYQPNWKPGDNFNQYYLGWAYPPNDYAKWGTLVNQWVKHAVTKYGRGEVQSWYWEIWNEPDIGYWHGTPEEYDKLYDFAADAIKRALPEARVGGPASTGPNGTRAAAFLKQFLEHCANGTNAVTGAKGAPLDFISYHAKGQPQVVDGHVRMGIAKNIADAGQGMQIVASFPQFQSLPIIISESDPEGCAACSARVYPQNAYRNGPLYASYEAAMMKNMYELADREKTNIAGMLTWAFEFEGQPYFEGFRTLASNGVDKPVLNVFRMAARMHGDRVMTESSGAIPVATMQASGVRAAPDVDALAVRSERELSILAWNYHDDDLAGPEAPVKIQIAGLPASVKKVTLHHYRIDETHSNAWTAWKNMGSPQQPTAEQYKALEAAGQLQELKPAATVAVGKELNLDLSLPRQGISLLQLSW
jgi:xylan 1,4-beta-xylosidase